MIKICNLRNENPQFSYDVRVDRLNKILGNKFYMKNETERDEVCDKYEVWFKEQIERQNKLVIDELKRLKTIYEKYGQLRLFCWCYPKRCHAETIKKYLEEDDNKENESNISVSIKYYLKEFELYDGECFIKFNIVSINFEKRSIEIAITNRGKISVREYDLFQDKYGDFYFEYGCMFEKIKINDFEEIED